MNSKDRVLMALNHEKSDRVPFNFWMDRRLMEQYEKEIGHRHWRVTHYGADLIETFPQLEIPTGKMVEHTGTIWLEEPLFDDWSKADSIELPDPSDDKVYELVKRDLQEFPDKAVVLDVPTSWGVIAGMMRGYENVYMDLYEHADQFEELSTRITDLQKVVIENVCKLGITALYIQEDLSNTEGLSMSPDMINQHCFSHACQLIEIANSYGIPTLFHCCAKIPDLLADMFIDLGVKAINPLQYNANNTADFASKYIDKLAVYGGIDNCFTIPQASPKEIEDHIFSQFELLGKPNGGLIFSSHDIDISAPRENIDAMVAAIKRCTY